MNHTVKNLPTVDYELIGRIGWLVVVVNYCISVSAWFTVDWRWPLSSNCLQLQTLLLQDTTPLQIKLCAYVFLFWSTTCCLITSLSLTHPQHQHTYCILHGCWCAPPTCCCWCAALTCYPHRWCCLRWCSCLVACQWCVHTDSIHPLQRSRNDSWLVVKAKMKVRDINERRRGG